MNAPQLWSDSEINQLDRFLLGDDSPENCMDPAMLDGFICAAVSGPRLILPSELLRWVWDTEQGQEEAEFKNQEEAQTIIGLILRQWNAINDILNYTPQDYGPVVYTRMGDSSPVQIIDEWCMGYYKGIEIDLPAWTPLLVGQPALFGTILRYGTDEGWAAIRAEGKDQVDLAAHQRHVDSLPQTARLIHTFWREQRAQQIAQGVVPSAVHRRETARREGPKIGRNDACPCGSGKKYKHCHGTT